MKVHRRALLNSLCQKHPTLLQARILTLRARRHRRGGGTEAPGSWRGRPGRPPLDDERGTRPGLRIEKSPEPPNLMGDGYTLLSFNSLCV